MINIRKDVFTHIILLPQSFFSDNRIGDLVQKVNNEIDNIRNFITNSLIRFVKNMLMITGSTVALCLLNYKLLLMVLIAAPLTGFVLLYFRPRLRAMLEKIRVKDADVITFFIESFNNIKLIQSYNTYEYEQQRLDNELHTRFKLGMKRIKLLALNTAFMSLIGVVTTIILFSYGGYLVIQETLTFGTLLAFMNYLIFLANPVKDMQSMYMEYIRVTVSMDRLKEILDAETIKEKNNSRVSRFNFSKNIHIQDIQFAYQDEEILSGLSLQLEKGKVYAIVGSSGCGKSTLMNLLMQFYDSDKGEILIDDTPLKGIDIFNVRDKITYVSQDSYLFNDSIIENIRRGNLLSTENEIIEACKQVGIYDYIQTLDNKFESKLGDRGSKISGGEKQRIALARVFLKKNDVLILDEAFGAIDSDSEKVILDRLRKFYKDSLIIIISHRLSTIKGVDEIIFLKDGKIAEKGKHEELLLKKRGYYQLFNEQLL